MTPLADAVMRLLIEIDEAGGWVAFDPRSHEAIARAINEVKMCLNDEVWNDPEVKWQP